MNEFGFVADNEINDNFGFVADVEEVKTQPIKQPTTVKPQLTEEQKQAEIARIKAEFEARNKKIDREHRKQMAKLYGGALLEIGSAAIPVGASLRLGGLALKAGKPIAQQVIKNLATRGAIEGGLSGLIGGVGRGMVEDKDLKGIGQTALTDAGIGLVGGAGLGAIGGKIATNVGKTGQRIKNIEAKQLTKKQPQVIEEFKTTQDEQGLNRLDLFNKNGENLGYASYYPEGNDLYIDYMYNNKIEKGVADRLVKKIIKDNPDKNIIWDAVSEKSQISKDKFIKDNPNLKDKIKGFSFEDTKKQMLIDENEALKRGLPKETVKKQIEKLQGGKEYRINNAGRLRFTGEFDNEGMPIFENYRGDKQGFSLTNQFDEIIEDIPEQVVEATPEQVSSDIKKRSLQQSVLEAKGTPKEVKEIIKEDMPTYEVMHNKDLIKQATQELEGNFDNELVRLASAKDFDALDYEKSHQIARQLFGMGDYRRAVDLIDNVSENATKKGQAIQALSLWSNMTPEGAVYKAQKLLKEYNKKHPKKQIQLTDENIETIANLQKEALNTTDELAKNQALARSVKYISELVPKNALQKLKAYRNISLLLNPKTLGRNIVGNALFNAIDTGAKALAVPIDRAIGLIPDNRFFNTVAKTRVAPSLKTYGKGLVEGAKTGYQEALQGIDTRGLGQRFDLGSGRTFQSKPMQALETALDIGLRAPDRAFYEATFAESVDNMMRARGLTQPTQEILEQAEQEALEAVFQNQSKLSDAALKTRRALNTVGTNDFGLGDVLIPYAQTPANLAQQGINYSPFGAVKGIANLAQGNQRQASLDFARSLLGTGLIGGGYGLSKAGLMTPSQFDDNYQTNKKIRENLQPLGIRPDQLGDMWYAPFQPMSIPLAVGNAVAYGKDPLQAGINTVVDLPFLQGISRGLRDLQEGNYAQAGVNVASSIPSQFVPTLGSQFAQTIDPYQRETYDPNKLQYGLNSAIAKVPFASKTLPEKIDVTGQPIERYSTNGGRKLFDIFLNPTFINKKTTDPVLSELKYIYDQTKETSHFMPSVKKKLEFIDVDGNTQKLVLTGREFSEYQRRLGQRMYNEFDYIMDLPEYANADEYGKIKILEKAKKLVQAEVDNEMWNKRNRNKKRSYTKGN